jgi:hypothetical protein
MATVLITAQVEDSAKWEQGFRTHADMFKNSYAAKSVRFASLPENEIATLWEVADAKAFTGMLQGQETIDAMKSDGVKRDTVKIFVLDKDVRL